MRNFPIHWHQGQFVRPQHLQAADRYWTELNHTSQHWDHSYGYGLNSLNYSRDALASNVFRVTQLEARMRDGTMVCLVQGQDLEINLKDYFDSKANTKAETSVLIQLAVPKLNLGAVNVADATERFQRRFYLNDQLVVDENLQASEQSVAVRKLSLGLVAGKGPEGFECLPLARVKIAIDRDAAPILDESYIPPVISTQAWSYLRRQYVQGIRDQIAGVIEAHSMSVKQLTIGRHSFDPADYGRFWMLNRLNEAYSVLSVLTPALGVHPLTAYLELARFLGQISVFAPERKAIAIEPYDHENLGGIFADMREKILRILHGTNFDEYLRANFSGVGSKMCTQLGPEWFDPGWIWYFGIERGGMSEMNLRSLIEDSSDWYWVFGSNNQADEFFNVRQDGLKIVPVNTTIPDLPSRQNWTYYKVTQDEFESPGWSEIRKTQSVAIRIRNYDDVSGAQHLDVFNTDGTRQRLRFALFAVRN
jgi:type VI secretion system protein ImpJ